jgi:thiol-disulfide isomerase/thioredoxin
MARLERVGAEAFDGVRLRRPGTVGVAFLAEWCPFCRAFEPEFAALAGTPSPALLVADLTSEDSPLWDRFGVDVVPTVIVFREGEASFRADGVAGEGLSPSALRSIRTALGTAVGAPKDGTRARKPRE